MDDLIFKAYSQLQRNPYPSLFPSINDTGRANHPTVRSKYFNVGQGIQTLEPGQTVILAQKEVPAAYAGVVTAFTQFFAGCEDHPDIINSITWGFRVNGEQVIDFPDFVGEFSKLYIPHHVYLPLIGGAQTLGTLSASPGSGPISQIPTVYLQATNNYNTTAVLQARLIGYVFPVDQVSDGFRNI